MAWGPWLSQQEEKVDIIFYLADQEGGAVWADYCSRQSDSVLYIGKGSTLPLQYPFKRQHNLVEELVLVHPQETSLPQHSQSWGQYFPNSRCHHIRYPFQKDVARLVRTLMGRAIGVVMGGGGARGFAHIGALKAFEELNIPIDIIGGTSMGSLVAASHALGWSPSHITDTFRHFFLESGGLQEYTIPLFSFIKGRKIKNALKALIQKIMIEDLWLPFFCVATNLTNGKKALHTQGELLEALLSSFAIPGVLPPVLKKGHILVDGAFLDNLPSDPCARKAPARLLP